MQLQWLELLPLASRMFYMTVQATVCANGHKGRREGTQQRLLSSVFICCADRGRCPEQLDPQEAGSTAFLNIETQSDLYLKLEPLGHEGVSSCAQGTLALISFLSDQEFMIQIGEKKTKKAQLTILNN